MKSNTSDKKEKVREERKGKERMATAAERAALLAKAKKVPSYLEKYLMPVETNKSSDYEDPKKKKKKKKVRTKEGAMKIVDEDASVSVENLKKGKKKQRSDFINDNMLRMLGNDDDDDEDSDDEAGELAPVVVNAEELETQEEKKRKRLEAERRSEGTWVTISENQKQQQEQGGEITNDCSLCCSLMSFFLLTNPSTQISLLREDDEDMTRMMKAKPRNPAQPTLPLLPETFHRQGMTTFYVSSSPLCLVTLWSLVICN